MKAFVIWFNVACAICLLFQGRIACAQDEDWWNTDVGNWFGTTNWDSDYVPTSTTMVYIDNWGTAQVFNNSAEALYVNLNIGGLIVNSSGTLLSNDGIEVDNGSVLTIQNGGTVSTASTGIVNGSTVTVNGTGSTWTHNGLLEIGLLGNSQPQGGSLTVANGGNLSDATAYVSAQHTITVDGASSSWHNSGDLYVSLGGNKDLKGGEDAGNLVIRNHGSVTCQNEYMGGSGNVTVSDTGSILTTDGDLYVPYTGAGDEPVDTTATLIVMDGGSVNVSEGAGTIFVAYGDGPSDGSTLGVLQMGDNGPAGTINAGAIVLGTGNAHGGDSQLIFDQTDDAYVFSVPIEGDGNIEQQGSGTTILTGSSGLWAGSLIVNDGELDINKVLGSYDSSNNSYITGGTLDVKGNFYTGTNIYIGYAGYDWIAPGTMTIENGGYVSDAGGIIGYAGSGGTVTVDGDLSEWTNSDALLIDTGSLTIQNQGIVSCFNGLTNESGSLTIQQQGVLLTSSGAIQSGGTVTVDGADSIWVAGMNLDVAGKIWIQNQATVMSSSGTIESGGLVTVNGASSVWDAGADLSVDGQMSVIQEGSVTNMDGDGQIDKNGLVTIDGANSSWTLGGDIIVGMIGSGTLNIRNGGTVISGVSENGDSTVYLGAMYGSAGTLQIGNGSAAGFVQAGKVYFGDGYGRLIFDHTNSNYSFNCAIEGKGAIIHEGSGTTILANDGSGFGGPTWVTNGQLVIEATLGSPKSSGNGYIGMGGLGSVVVTGSDSQWNNASLNIGYTSSGVLTIQNGGAVTVNNGNGTVYIGTQPSSVGTLQIGNGGVAGSLDADIVHFGAGTGSLIFNHTGSCQFDPAITGNGSVTKLGPGTLYLYGSSSYTGTTAVNAGALYVDNDIGSGTGSGLVEVANGATLGGEGDIGGSVTMAGGAILSPGDPVGALSIWNNLTLTGSSSPNASTALQFNLGTNIDEVLVSSNLALGGILTISTNAGGFTTNTYTLFQYGGSLTISNLTIGSAPAGFAYTLKTTTPGLVQLVVGTLIKQPKITKVNISNTNITFTGSGGPPNGPFYILTSTNLFLPKSSWQILATNYFDSNGNCSATNSIIPNTLHQYYMFEDP